MTINTTPTLNLKAVLKETGLTADTLRAWERRYGLPMPERSPGGHRLYSQRDVAIIKWLMAKQKEGLSISRAVDLWNELTAEGQEPLPATIKSSEISTPSANLDSVRSLWIRACMDFNEAEAENVLNQAFGMHPVEQVCTQVLQRGIAEIGKLWYENQASVQQEHFATSLAIRRIDALLAAAPRPFRPQTILIGCPPDEWHTFIPLMLTLFLRRRGINIVYLGANVPLERFEETINTIKPNLVVITAQQLHSAASLEKIASMLNKNNIAVGFGGRIFNLNPELIDRIPAHFLGNDIDNAIENIEALLSNPRQSFGGIEAPDQFKTALSVFIQRRPYIDARVTHAKSEDIDPYSHIHVANLHMGDNLSAALHLGNLSLLDQEFNWVEGMLGNIEMGKNELGNYLTHYKAAIQEELGNKGAPIVNWLLEILEYEEEK